MMHGFFSSLGRVSGCKDVLVRIVIRLKSLYANFYFYHCRDFFLLTYILHLSTYLYVEELNFLFTLVFEKQNIINF